MASMHNVGFSLAAICLRRFCYFPVLVSKGIRHCWIFPGGFRKWKLALLGFTVWYPFSVTVS